MVKTKRGIMHRKMWILLITIFVAFDAPLFATPLTDGGVGSIINIIVETDNKLVTDVPDLRSYNTPVGGSIIARVKVDNNDMHGFGVTIERAIGIFGMVRQWLSHYSFGRS